MTMYASLGTGIADYEGKQNAAPLCIENERVKDYSLDSSRQCSGLCSTASLAPVLVLRDRVGI
jgi:hypothetical protein